MKLKNILALGFIGLIAACSPPTQLTSTWTDPSVNATTFKGFKKILVIARLSNETTNRIAEDKMVAQLAPGRGVQSYNYLTTADTNQNELNAKLQKDGFDGMILMRLNNVDKSIDIQSDGGGFYGRGFYGGGMTTVSTDKTYMVQTSCYDLLNSKMLWTGTTSTLNPTDVGAAIDQIIAADKAQLQKQGLIPPPTNN
jgi:hypothetical protein